MSTIDTLYFFILACYKIMFVIVVFNSVFLKFASLSELSIIMFMVI